MLLTLKQKNQAILPNPRASFTVKSNLNNGGSGPNARLCAQDGREEEGEDGVSFLYCYFITTSSCLELTVTAPNHCQLLVRTSSDKWPSTHCQCKPQTMWSFAAGFFPVPIIFSFSSSEPAVKVHHCRFTLIRQ